MHPRMPTLVPGRSVLCFWNWSILPQIRCSALSLMEQVLAIITSAPAISSVLAYPALPSMAKTTSVSATFIWQP